MFILGIILQGQHTEEAVVLFAEALQLCVEQHGELSLECIDCYREYGLALLQRAQESADVFGDAQVARLASAKDKEGDTAPHDADDDSDDDEDEVRDGDDEDVDEGKKENEVDDETDIDLAWSMFDVCRAIYEQNGGDDMFALELAEIYQSLGDVRMEQEKFDESTDEFKKALSLLSLRKDKDDRSLAELYYKMCLSYQFAERPAEAREACEAAVNIFKRRLSPGLLLKQMSEPELKEQRSVLAELELKLDEVRESEEMHMKTKAVLKAALAGMAGAMTGPERSLTGEDKVGKSNDIVFSNKGISSMGTAILANNQTIAVQPQTTGASSSKNNSVFDTPSISLQGIQQSHTNIVKDLGVGGRGQKRITPVSTTQNGPDELPPKRPALGMLSTE